jgi:hypothetical protein
MSTTYPAVPEEQAEKFSSAATLSDMEVFIYPELLFSLVLANIMSPRLWAWRSDPWFDKIEKLTPYRRILRLKQFIIDRYEFNLDLDTWGLTTQARELARFRPWMDERTLAESNALFGYHGDQYYFTLDIRKHFGLDSYSSDTIPYWKTETLEAMDAFRFREGYATGAGECVSLSTLYAAALFVVCGIPLEEIHLMATPLHSQNFVTVRDGILTNNRRVVTKAMWFNGTELTAKAQRALRHEQVTIVANHTGYIHVVYPDATIEPASYAAFRKALGEFLVTDLNMEILANFLRHHSQLQKCFQLRHVCHGKPRWIAAEKVYSYEHASSFKVSDATRDKLLEEIDEYEFFSEPIEGRIPLNQFEDFFRQNKPDLNDEPFQRSLMAAFNCQNARAGEILHDLKAFIALTPRLPDDRGPKRFIPSPPISLRTGMTREEVLGHLQSLRPTHPVADLAFYAYRDWAGTDRRPFLKAALERSPVSIVGTKALADDEVVHLLRELPNESIYDGTRMAQPDEVWNFRRGDGLERAITLANIWKARHPDDTISIVARDGEVEVAFGQRRERWPTGKGLAAEFAF